MYKAVKKETSLCVAIKRISLGIYPEGFPKEIINEIKLLKSFDHPNIIQFFEVGADKCTPSDRLPNDPISARKPRFNVPWDFFIVCEYADHSLAGLLPNIFLSEPDMMRLVRSCQV